MGGRVKSGERIYGKLFAGALVMTVRNSPRTAGDVTDATQARENARTSQGNQRGRERSSSISEQLTFIGKTVYLGCEFVALGRVFCFRG
jgi:hypothetical protein